jgi:hypothetical protein
MTEPNAVVFTTTLQWPQGALGERALLAFEPYDVTSLALDEKSPVAVDAWLTERGFIRLVEGAWSFPQLEGHVLGVFADLGEMSLLDEAADLFTYPLSGLPSGWCAHLMRERSCLVITGIDLRLATERMGGIERAVRRGNAFAGMVMINEGLD